MSGQLRNSRTPRPRFTGRAGYTYSNIPIINLQKPVCQPKNHHKTAIAQVSGAFSSNQGAEPNAPLLFTDRKTWLTQNVNRYSLPRLRHEQIRLTTNNIGYTNAPQMRRTILIRHSWPRIATEKTDNHELLYESTAPIRVNPRNSLAFLIDHEPHKQHEPSALMRPPLVLSAPPSLRYIPQSLRYLPQPLRYLSQPLRYLSQPLRYLSQPLRYSPQLFRYVPQSFRLTTRNSRTQSPQAPPVNPHNSCNRKPFKPTAKSKAVGKPLDRISLILVLRNRAVCRASRLNPQKIAD
jgi:hypothetical protein